MPYIYVPQINAKFLIDTGSSKSLMNPKLAYKFYKNFIFKEQFHIQSAHDISYHDQVAEIPIFNIFKINQTHKFYLFEFSPNYDGLIGIDLLKQLNATVNMNNKLLETPYSLIPIHFNQNSNTVNNINELKSYSIVIQPRTRQVVKIPVKHNCDAGILEYTNFDNGVEMPKALVNVMNNFAITTLTNIKENPVKIKFSEPLDIEPLNLIDVNFVEKMETDDILSKEQDNLLKQNLKNLRLEHCNEEEKHVIRELCYEYRDVFYCDDIPLSFTNQMNHKIKLKNEFASPIFTKSYRFPEIHKNEVRTQINKMLEQGIIQDSVSPWSSPVWIVPKKMDASGKKKWRLVIDYRKLNEMTVDDKYPLPNITDILDKLGKANYFTTIDLASGFHQIEVDQQDIPKTAFSVEGGHYEYCRMPFGLKNAPSSFQRIMDNILRGLQNEICLVYLDDIIIYSTSLQEHIDRLKLVFDRLRSSNFKVQMDKTEFLQKTVQFLGHVITPDGVKPNPDKITAIKNFPIPKTQTEIKSFLGLLGYYRRFIPNLSKITKPMTKCLKKNCKVIHDNEFLESFKVCKDILTNEPILQYPDFTKPFILTTDASGFALGAVLSQGDIPHDRPIAYASRTLNDTEVKYSTIEKELLAIVWACKYFRPYLYGKRFKIYTDHRPLTWLFSMKEPNSKLVRWRLRLEEYDYEIIYKKGKHNTNADCLSRISLNALETESVANNVGDIDQTIVDYLRNIAENLDLPSSSSTTPKPRPKIHIISNVQYRPPNIIKDKPPDIENANNIQNDNTKNNSDTETVVDSESTIEISDEEETLSASTQHSNINETTNDGIPSVDDIINNKINQILVFVSRYPKLDVINERYENSKIINVKIPEVENENLILQFLKNYTDPKNTYYIHFEKDKLYHAFLRIYLKHFSEKGAKIIRCLKKVNTVSDKEEQIVLMKHHHEGKTNHRGINETLEYLKTNYYWKNMKNTISNFINSCEICQRSKYARHKPYVPQMVTETPAKPFQIIHIDIFTFDKQMYLTIVDAFSKFAQAFPIISKTAIHVSNALIKYFTSFGIPRNLVLDNGTEFNNIAVKELLKLHKIHVHFTTPAHHESNSIIERFHSSIIEHLRILKEIYPDERDNLMDYAIIAYNNTIHSATNYSPFELTFGHTDSRNPIEIFTPNSFFSEYAENHKSKLKHVYQNVHEKLQNKKEKVIDKINVNGDTSNEFAVGQIVYKQNPYSSRNKKLKKFLGPYKITKLLDRNRVEIYSERLKNNKSEIIHIKELKKPPKVIETPILTDLPSTSSEQTHSSTI